jgi:hypothetical protein
MPASAQPFTVAVPDDVLDDLHSRLKLARFPDELDGAGTAYGSPLGDMQRLVARWRDGYDWRRREAEINKLPQYMLPIEVGGFGTLDIHFIHQRSTVEGAIPLLFVHGCESLSPNFVCAGIYGQGFRAWPLPRSGKGPTAPHSCVARSSEFSRRCA